MIDALKAKANELMISTSYEQIKLLSFKSIYNFTLYFNDLPDIVKPKVEKILSDYFLNIEEADYFFDKKSSTSLYDQYIGQIGPYYKLHLNFKFYMSLKSTLFWGLISDLILCLLGLLQKIYFIPISTCVLILYHLFIEFGYASKNKCFGLRY